MTDTPLAPDAPRPGFAVTLALIALNVGMFLFLAVGQGLSWTEPSNVELTRWGANVSALTLTGDTWRLLSSMFLHGGIVHLLMNMYMLLVLGLVAEARFRSSRCCAPTWRRVWWAAPSAPCGTRTRRS